MMSRTANWGRFARAAGGLEARLLRAFALSILSLLLLGGCNTGRSASTPDSALAASADALAPTLVSTDTAQPVVALFVTPVPVRAEEPLAGASRNVPSIFEGVAAYAPVPAVLTAADALEWSAPTIAEAARAVVQIRRCDVFGCTTPVGSGVIIHTNGLVLTAFHVLLVDPNDPNSDRHSDLVIATTENTRSAPQPRYRARLIASKPDQDLALLAIDRDAGTNQPVDVRELQLPTLPLADVATLFGDELHVLGFPTSGGEAISYDRVNFRSFDDNGRVIVVNQPLDRGNSGGPALVMRDGHFAIAGLVIRRRSTQGQLSQEGLLRAIDQLHSLTWTPNVMRAWAENVQAIQSSNETNALQFSLILNTLDLVDTPLRLLFYATDAATGQPWQPASAGAPLVVWADVTLQQVFARQTLTLTVPVDALGAPPERLRFHPLLWDVGQGAHRWEALADGVQPAPVAVAMATTASSTDTPAAVDTATSLPAETTILTTTAIQTDTPTPADTPTLDLVATQTAEAQNLATAVAATLAAQFTSTPTPSATLNFEQRLATAVAATLAAQATVTSTPTTTLAPPTNTATATPTPTVTRRPTVTDTPESTSTPMTPLANYPLQPYGPGWPMVGGNSANTSWNVRESKLKPPFRELWHWDVDGIFFSEELTYYAGVVYVTGSQRQEGRVGQEIYAIEIGASEPLWSQHLEEGEASVGHGVAIAGDKVFFGSQSNDSLFLADARSGEILQVYTGFTSLYERHVKVADGVAYAASAVVRAIRASNGEVLWRVDLGDVRGNNAVVNDLYVTGSDQNNQGGMAMELVALHTADGAIVWRTPSLRGHTVMSDGESVYTVASSTNDRENMDSVVAYNLQTGDEVWRQELNYPIGFWAKGALGDGRLFFEGGPRDGDDRRIYAFDSLSGQLIDIIVYPGDHWIYDMAIANGLLYVGTRYQLDVYDTDSLAKVWSGFGTVNQIAIADGMLLVLAGSTVYAYVPE